MATARDKALQEIAKLSPETRKYLTSLAKKSGSMNQRSMGSGDEYTKGQVRASKGAPKRVYKKPPARKATKPATKSAASSSPRMGRPSTSRASSKPATNKYSLNMDEILGR